MVLYLLFSTYSPHDVVVRDPRLSFTKEYFGSLIFSGHGIKFGNDPLSRFLDHSKILCCALKKSKCVNIL